MIQPSPGISGMSKYITIQRVAERLGISRRTVKRNVSRGFLPRPIKIGQKVLFVEDEVEAALKKLTEPAK